MKLDIEAQEQMVVKQWLALKLQAEIEAGAIGYEINGNTQREKRGPSGIRPSGNKKVKSTA